ncbi:unnamed protein product [Rangifer tarandus platyrhynchus]|uniref:Uncharacterized protein n=1 Tax=Rangifer tarandus platyrhynchus TaxID=3082113 RepID=A0AC59YFH6_RANTA
MRRGSRDAQGWEARRVLTEPEQLNTLTPGLAVPRSEHLRALRVSPQPIWPQKSGTTFSIPGSSPSATRTGAISSENDPVTPGSHVGDSWRHSQSPGL